MRRLLAVSLLAASVGAGAGYFVRQGIGRRIPLAPVLETSGPPRPLTEWFYADGRVMPDSTIPSRSNGDSLSPAREWLGVFNPGAEPAEIAVTFYFENLTPQVKPLRVPAHTSTNLAVHESVPPGLRYGVKIQSSRPVIVQPTRGEYLPNNIVTQAMASRIAYPGPLGKRETRWAYADGVVLDNETPLLEWEWVSILNPSEQPARVVLRFEQGSTTTHELEVASHRMASVNLATLKVFPRNQVAGVIVESSQPVVVEQVRRAYHKDHPMLTALWSCFAHPIGDVQY